VTCKGTKVSEQYVAQNTAWGNAGYRFHCSLESSVVCRNTDLLIFAPEHVIIPSGVLPDGTSITIFMHISGLICMGMV